MSTDDRDKQLADLYAEVDDLSCPNEFFVLCDHHKDRIKSLLRNAYSLGRLAPRRVRRG